MDTRNRNHWQDVALTLLGLWLAVSPFAMGLAAHAGVVAASIALGLALLASAAGALLAPRAWEHWATLAMGVVILLSPWLAGFAEEPLAMGHALAVGAAAAVLSLWRLWQRGALSRADGVRRWAH